MYMLNVVNVHVECMNVVNVHAECMNVVNVHAEYFFSFYVPVGRGTALDGEIAAIRTALSQLQCHLEKFTRAVICDSRAALLAIVSNNNPKTQDILDCHYHLENLASLEKL
ncbi:hypothetical protein CDAR_308291 [Caerostris darwini]|uniref:RNase H type-1 domain-containing protein n=1 Tax=Caerostris darwini TaxID=1538125 RepID=A0AAV4SAM2_9ARAC|nr:hypothetical protein CDAR_308291 [Caerostris darwini]